MRVVTFHLHKHPQESFQGAIITKSKIKILLTGALNDQYSNHLNTGLDQYLNGGFVSGNGPVFEWWSEDRIEKTLVMVQDVWYSNGKQSHMTLPFEYQIPIIFSVNLMCKEALNLILKYLTSSQGVVGLS